MLNDKPHYEKSYAYTLVIQVATLTRAVDQTIYTSCCQLLIMCTVYSCFPALLIVCSMVNSVMP